MSQNILIINQMPNWIRLTVYHKGQPVETVELDKQTLHLLNQSKIELIKDYRVKKENVITI